MIRTLLERFIYTTAKDVKKDGITTPYTASDDLIYKDGGLQGYRYDLKHFMKSKMEANVYRFYKYLEKKHGKIAVGYETDTFRFKPNKYNIKYYCPDFKVTSDTSTFYVEVKGVLDNTSVQKARLLSQEYTRIKLYFILPQQYQIIKSCYSKMIENWE